MNLTDWIILAILAAAAIAAFLYGRRKNSCSLDCSKCSRTCANKKPGDVPDFVKAYRRDHPKSPQSNPGIHSDTHPENKSGHTEI